MSNPDRASGASQSRDREDGDGPRALRSADAVATLLDVPHHVLRRWETEFPEARPVRRGFTQRWYRPNDVAALTKIRALIYDDGHSPETVRRLLRGGPAPARPGARAETAEAEPLAGGRSQIAAAVPAARGLSWEQKAALRGIIAELRSLRDRLAAVGGDDADR